MQSGRRGGIMVVPTDIEAMKKCKPIKSLYIENVIEIISDDIDDLMKQ